jgi:CRP-like cAMP-binding protein
LRNLFFKSLSEADLLALRPSLTHVSLKTGERIVDQGGQVDAAYLPLTCILSVITTMRSGASVESRTVGYESGFGLLHALGSRHAYERVEVQVSGEACRIPVSALREAAARSPALTTRIVKHAQATLVQSAQSVACMALHGATERMCRWLLLTRDRLNSDLLPLTQEHLGIMLGVQRTTVTAIAMDLQKHGFIRYSRGRIQLLDIQGLQGKSCECYGDIEFSIETLLSSDQAEL